MLFSANTFAQLTGIPSIFLNKTFPEERPVELSDLNISVYVVGNIATTTMEMNFFNPNKRVMEGELNFPMANGVTVSRFALDVNGEMREGVVVDKEKATQAFEAVIRQKIDPGLVEVTKGNNFKARVYPIPPNGYKKAIIAFDQELTGDNKNYIYRLPLDIPNVLREFNVKVEVVMNRPQPVKSDDPSINLEFTEVRNSWISEYHDTHISFSSSLAFALPVPEDVKEVVTFRGSVTSDNYFYVNLKVKPETRVKARPGTIMVVWDESASGKNRDNKKDLAILDGYIKWLGSGQVNLVTFANAVISNKTFAVADGKCDGLISYLMSLKYDGGTNLGAIDLSKTDAREILLFTDGLSNFGGEKGFSSASPVIAINSSAKSNHSLMEQIAMSSAGTYVNASELTADEIIKSITSQQKQFIRADYDSQKVKEFLIGSGLSTHGDFSCSGIMEGAKSDLTLHFGFGKEITESHTITIDNSQLRDNNLGERIWAQKKLKTLLVENDEAAIKAHGKKFSLVTPGTSLIVLDNVQDYVRYEILPPPSLQKQYNEMITIRNQKTDSDRQFRISRICTAFKEDVKWWENAVDYRNMKEPARGSKPVKPANSQTISGVRVVSDAQEVDDEIVIDAQAEYEVSAYSVPAVAEDSNVVGLNGSARKKESIGSSQAPKINIRGWESNAPYISSLKSVDPADVYSKYLEIRTDYENSPSFYFDAATYMFQKSLNSEGLRVLSNLAELELEDPELMRTLGRKLLEYKFTDEAIAVFEEIMRTRSFEPHSYFDLGLAYAEKGEYQKAIDNLYTVIDKNWDSDIISRFPGIELIILHEINSIIFHHGKELDISGIDQCLLKSMALDMRIVIDWDANDTDIDLWIKDPWKEECGYSHQNTRMGGKISNDITRGYGPEEFRLKHAVKGKYTIEAKFFGSRKQAVKNKITVRAFVYTRYGTAEETRQVLTMQLEPNKQGQFVVGEVEF